MLYFWHDTAKKAANSGFFGEPKLGFNTNSQGQFNYGARTTAAY